LPEHRLALVAPHATAADQGAVDCPGVPDHVGLGAGHGDAGVGDAAGVYGDEHWFAPVIDTQADDIQMLAEEIGVDEERDQSAFVIEIVKIESGRSAAVADDL
jgi:hypothetical protein